ncbi:short-chain fatty acid transporter [Aliidongia dinghuensis]|uniref:short-chain fatty acid transporter n=1 Tax=Aliidongia dinghuensis TaxID=1867774 RepID=UPI00166CFB14|nr:TIGR00366 family protein [Aliidongia dinghuensis]
MTIAVEEPRRRGLVSLSVYLFEQLMPDPFVIAIALTVFVALLAALLAPHGTPEIILSSWYAGIFNILGFAFQMILILVTGHVLAHAPPVQRGLKAIVALAKTPAQAVVLTFLLAALASWLNWGFGLVIGALLAREVAKRMRLDFAWLVAAAYSGWVIWASGISGSIALAQATHGNALNIVEKLTGNLIGFDQTIFAPVNVIPTLLIVIAVPIAFLAIRPAEADLIAFTPTDEAPAASGTGKRDGSIAQRLEQSMIGSLLIAAAGAAYLVMTWSKTGVSLDINAMIFLFLIFGLALHGTPVAYVAAMRNAAKQTGSMMLQYPIYGGIMGIMTSTGLAEVISKYFVAFSTTHSLPFWSYIASLFITFLVPSGGGHWAVQGPFVIPAAVSLHASIPATTLAVAMGEDVANMLQPFWALPVVAMAGIGIQRVLGYTTVTFLVAGVINGAALLLLA